MTKKPNLHTAMINLAHNAKLLVGLEEEYAGGKKKGNIYDTRKTYLDERIKDYDQRLKEWGQQIINTYYFTVIDEDNNTKSGNISFPNDVSEDDVKILLLLKTGYVDVTLITKTKVFEVGSPAF